MGSFFGAAFIVVLPIVLNQALPAFGSLGGLQIGKPDAILAKPVTIAEDIAGISSGTTPIAYGDFRRGYLIVDRMGVRVLRDPYSNKPYVQFYTTKRVGGGVQNFEAIKLLKLAA